jgi:hypothetical protein
MDACHTMTPRMQSLGADTTVSCHLYGVTAEDGTVIQPPVALDDEGARRHAAAADS